MAHRRFNLMFLAALAFAGAGGAHAASNVPVDARVYGVTCNGTTDDTTALQTAFNSGAPLQLPPGICKITATLKMNSLANNGQWIQGAGETDEGNLTQAGRTIIKPAAGVNPAISIDGTSLSSHYVIAAHLSGFTIDMTNNPDSTDTVGIGITQGFDLSFDHIRVYSAGYYRQRGFQINQGVYGSVFNTVQATDFYVNDPGGYGGNPTTLTLINADLFSIHATQTANLHMIGGAVQPVWDAGNPQPVTYVASGATNMLGFYPTVAMFNASNGNTGGFYMAVGASFDNMQYLLTSTTDFEQGGPLPVSCTEAGLTWPYGTYNDGTHGCHPILWVVQVTNTVFGCDIDQPNAAGLYILLPSTNSCMVRGFGNSGTGLVPIDFFGNQAWFDSTMNLMNGQAFHGYSDYLQTQTLLLDASNGDIQNTYLQTKPVTDGAVLSFSNAANTLMMICGTNATPANSSCSLDNGAGLYWFSDNGSTQTAHVYGNTGAAKFGQITVPQIIITPATNNSDDIYLTKADGTTAIFDCGTSSGGGCQMVNGAAFYGFSGAFTGQTYKLDSSNGNGTFTGQVTGATVKTATTTVAGLPSAATAGAGAQGFVTDATACTFAATPTGGGAVKCPVYSDGAAWKEG